MPTLISRSVATYSCPDGISEPVSVDSGGRSTVPFQFGRRYATGVRLCAMRCPSAALKSSPIRRSAAMLAHASVPVVCPLSIDSAAEADLRGKERLQFRATCQLQSSAAESSSTCTTRERHTALATTQSKFDHHQTGCWQRRCSRRQVSAICLGAAPTKQPPYFASTVGRTLRV
jgi:hypothetical protein